jgi:hypothetical protein
MVLMLRYLATLVQLRGWGAAGKLVMVVLVHLALCGLLPAQEETVHYLHQGVMPPGAIGSRQLQRGGPLPGFFQPVEIKAPSGVLISLARQNQFDAPQAAPCRAGFLIGSVYRFRVTNIPRAEGLEVFPTVEVIDRLYAPEDQAARFAILVEMTQDDLELALSGRFVTRVIYLEDPRNALPVASDKSPIWFDVGPKRDPLAVADGLGRPVAILRLGARLPDQGFDPHFFFGSPPWLPLPPRPIVPQKPPAPPAKRAPKAPVAAKPEVIATPEKPQP